MTTKTPKSIFEKAWIIELQALNAMKKEFSDWSGKYHVVKGEDRKFRVELIEAAPVPQFEDDQEKVEFTLTEALAESGETIEDLKDDGHSLGDAMANATMGAIGLPQRLSSVKSPVKRVWDIADSMPKASRKDVVAECIRQGVGAGTARTQYQAWFKASQESKRDDIRQPYEKVQKDGE